MVTSATVVTIRPKTRAPKANTMLTSMTTFMTVATICAPTDRTLPLLAGVVFSRTKPGLGKVVGLLGFRIARRRLRAP